LPIVTSDTEKIAFIVHTTQLLVTAQMTSSVNIYTNTDWFLHSNLGKGKRGFV